MQAWTLLLEREVGSVSFISLNLILSFAGEDLFSLAGNALWFPNFNLTWSQLCDEVSCIGLFNLSGRFCITDVRIINAQQSWMSSEVVWAVKYSAGSKLISVIDFRILYILIAWVSYATQWAFTVVPRLTLWYKPCWVLWTLVRSQEHMLNLEIFNVAFCYVHWQSTVL